MDTLSRLLYLHPMQTALDTRCQLRAPWHIASHDEPPGVAPYHLVVEGSCKMDVKGQDTVCLKVGDMLVFPRAIEHSLYTSSIEEAIPIEQDPTAEIVTLMNNAADGPLTDIICGQFHFDPLGGNALMAALPEVVLVRTGCADFAGLQALATLLRDETGQDRPGGHAVVSHLASSLFSLLIRAWLDQTRPDPGIFALLTEPRLSAALSAILNEPEKPWSVQSLAEVCHMSRTTFARLFQSVAGATPGNVLLRTRMAQAANYLSHDKRSVAEIGEAVGYQSEAAFNRAFKRCFEMGPGQYRNQHETAA